MAKEIVPGHSDFTLNEDGSLSVPLTVDGRDLLVDGVKLDDIEAGADITDNTNVDAAGATMNADVDISLNDWVIDEDNMVSNLATKVPTQQSVKAYVDVSGGGTHFNIIAVLGTL